MKLALLLGVLAHNPNRRNADCFRSTIFRQGFRPTDAGQEFEEERPCAKARGKDHGC